MSQNFSSAAAIVIGAYRFKQVVKYLFIFPESANRNKSRLLFSSAEMFTKPL